MRTGSSSADEEEIKKPDVALKGGRGKYPKIEDVQMEPTTAGAANESAAGAEVCRLPLCLHKPMLIKHPGACRRC